MARREVEYTDEFGAWWQGLSEAQQESVFASVGLLRFHGPRLGHPIGGDKTGSNRWYEKFVPLADRLYDEHLAELKKEGLIDDG